MICAMTVTMSGQSYWYNKFDYAIILFLGKFSMPLFLNHLAWIKYWPVIAHRIGISFSGEQDILISVLFAIGTSCFIMYGGNVLKKISLKNVLITKD